MKEVTTIQVRRKVVNELKAAKQYPRQTYSDVILELTRINKSYKSRNQYDEFLHKIQQERMKHLWDNKEDEAWENA